MCVVCMHLCLGLSGSIFTQPYSYLLISWSDGINNFIHLSSHLLLYYKVLYIHSLMSPLLTPFTSFIVVFPLYS